MDVTVDLPADVVDMLTRNAAEYGLPLVAQLRWLLLRGMESDADFAGATEALLRDYPNGGWSDDELCAYVHKARHEFWEGRRNAAGD